MHKMLLAATCGCAVAAMLAGCSAAPVKAARTPRPTASASSQALSTLAHVNNPTADAAAAAVLNAEDAKLAARVKQGTSVMATGAQIAWWKQFGDATRLETEMMAVFKAADSHFDADDEAPSITTWRDSTLPGDVESWYLSDTGSGPTAAATQQVNADLAALNAAAASVAHGH